MRPLRTSIAFAILLLGLSSLSCGGDDKNPTNPGGGGGAADETITIVANNGANSYSPDPDTVLVGQTVAWHNADGTPHTATANVGPEFTTGTLGAGSTSAKITMGTVGSFPYHCVIHGLSMAGTLVVK